MLFLNLLKWNFKNVLGLDPAYPGYSVGGQENHLTKGDAIFVDVLHSNPGILGFPQPIGDVDFYPNPGTWIQPGCWFDDLIKNRELSYFCKYTNFVPPFFCEGIFF